MTLSRRLELLAARVRSSMESSYGNPSRECYRWSSYVACEISEKFGAGAWMVVGSLSVGTRMCPHAWVEWEGWIVDITADQFNEAKPGKFPPVWLVEAGKSSAHVADYRRPVRHPAW